MYFQCDNQSTSHTPLRSASKFTSTLGPKTKIKMKEMISISLFFLLPDIKKGKMEKVEKCILLLLLMKNKSQCPCGGAGQQIGGLTSIIIYGMMLSVLTKYLSQHER